MAAISAPIQTSFNAGELGPLVYGREDFPKYSSGLQLCQNFVTQIQGGVTRRPGGKYAAASKGFEEAYLKPFVFSTGDAFLLEFGDEYVRFFRDREVVYETAQDITGITQADPAVLTYSGADNYANGDEVKLDAIVGMTELNGRTLKVANVDTGANTFELTDLDGNNIDSTGYTAYSSAGTVEKVFELVSPYAIEDVPFIRILQSRDVLYIAHPSYAPRKLSRSGFTNWSFAEVEFEDGPYLDENKTTTTLTNSATTGSITLTASSITGINNDTGFQSTDVGRLVRFRNGTAVGWGVITAVGSTTQVTLAVDADAPLTGTGARTTWRLGEWSETTGFPSVIFMFEDRLGWAASPIAPVTLNMSRSGDYENMAPTDLSNAVTASHALQLKANQKRQDPVRWVFDDEKGLICGTKGAEFVARSSTTGQAVSAENIPALRRSTKWGSANVSPVEVGKEVLFAQASKKKLRKSAYSFEVDGFKSPDLTVLASHALQEQVAEMVYQQEPHSIVWCRTESGSLWAMTYDEEQEVIAWHRHLMGGHYDSGKTVNAKVEALATLPSPDGTSNDLWLVVNRYINGQNRRYIEYLDAFNEHYDDVSDCYFLDAGITFEPSSPTSEIHGLHHLEGETVDMLIDGKPTTTKTVSGGIITADIEVSSIAHVGLNYMSRIQTLRQRAGAANGTAQGKTKRTHKLIGRFHQTVGCWVGREFDNAAVPMDAVDFREGNHLMGAAVSLFSGDKELDYEDDYTSEGQVCIETRQPLPCTILALMPQMKVEDNQ